MKFKAALAIVLSCSCLQACARELLSITNHFEQRTWTCRLTEEDLANSPKWVEAEPPLAPGKAMKIAEDYVTGLVDDSLLIGGRWGIGRVFSATLQPAGPRDWIYVVRVFGVRAGSNSSPGMDIIVLMDGRIPKYTEELANESKNR